MSYSHDLLLDAPNSLEELSAFLVSTCALRLDEPDGHGRPIHSCDEFYCFLVDPSEVSRSLLTDKFGFTPKCHLSCYLKSPPHVDPHPRLVESMQLLILEYDCNCAWLGDCSYPHLLKVNGHVRIQGDHSPYSHWADYLNRIAKEIGLPYETTVMPAL